MKEKMNAVISQLFTACVFLFMVLGVILVAGQIISVIMRNGAWCVAIDAAIKIWMIRVAAMAGILGFVNGYLKPSKPKTAE